VSPCPICGISLLGEPSQVEGMDSRLFDCPNCRRYVLDQLFATEIPERSRANPRSAALVSHVICRAQRDSGVPVTVDAASWDR
jgi:Zn-finger nucleic acid-binding protein